MGEVIRFPQERRMAPRPDADPSAPTGTILILPVIVIERHAPVTLPDALIDEPRRGPDDSRKRRRKSA